MRLMRKVEIVFKELIKIKSNNLKLIELIRGNVTEIFDQAQEAADYLEKLYKMIKKDK